MIDKMFNEMGDDPAFKKVINGITEHIVLDISNDLKFGKIDVDDDIAGAVLLLCLREFSFPFLKAMNFALNSGDADKLGDVNEFIDTLQSLHINAENKKKEVMNNPKMY